ncbi:MAG: DNA alkylation repair protein [Anaerolineae bacterium]
MDESQRMAALHAVQDDLRRNASPELAARAQRFFTENPPILGSPVGLSEQLGKELALQVRREGELADAVWLAGRLFASGHVEEGACANTLLESFHKRFGLADWPLFDRWLDDFTCWATTDSFCLKVAAHVVLRCGPPVDWLMGWANADLIWKRRASLVSLIRCVRVAREVDLAFTLCDSLLADEQPLVQKAIGWLLKELCKGDQAATERYLETRAGKLRRSTVSYAREGF